MVSLGSMGKKRRRSAYGVGESALVEMVGPPGFLPIFGAGLDPGPIVDAKTAVGAG